MKRYADVSWMPGQKVKKAQKSAEISEKVCGCRLDARAKGLHVQIESTRE